MRSIITFLAIRYYFKEKSTQAVTIILRMAVAAFLVSTAAMFIVLSVFSGLKELNLSIYTKESSDIKIYPYQGKILRDTKQLQNFLKLNEKVKAYSKVIEEKVYVQNEDKNQIAYIKGVEENYKNFFGLDTYLIAGSYFSGEYTDEVIVANDLAYRLSLSLSKETPFELYVPKKGKRIIRSEEDAFNTAEVYMQGVFVLSDRYQNYIFAPLELVQELLELDASDAYAIEIHLHSPEQANAFKKEFFQKFPKGYIVKTALEQEDALIKMMNTEGLVIYLIFILILILGSFNLAGAVTIIILDKKIQNKTLYALGLDIPKLKKVYFLLGGIITTVGTGLGLLLGSLVIWLQLKFNIVKVTEKMAFPVKIELSNYLYVTAIVMLIGWTVSFISSRNLKWVR